MGNIIWDGDTSEVYTLAGNWQGAAAPGAADDVFLPSGCTNAIAGSDETGTALTSFTTKGGYSGTLGSITDGKPLRLQIKATTINLAGTGVSYFTASTATACNVTGAASAAGTGQYGLDLTSATGADKIITLNINLASGQSMGIAALPGEVAEATTVNISGSGTVTLGAGLTTTTVNVSGGTANVHCSVTTLTVTGGTVYVEEGTITTETIKAGTLYHKATTTVTTANVYGTLDFDEDVRAKTVTTCNLYKGGTVIDSNNIITFTNGIVVQEGMTIQAA